MAGNIKSKPKNRKLTKVWMVSPGESKLILLKAMRQLTDINAYDSIKVEKIAS